MRFPPQQLDASGCDSRRSVQLGASARNGAEISPRRAHREADARSDCLLGANFSKRLSSLKLARLLSSAPRSPGPALDRPATMRCAPGRDPTLVRAPSIPADTFSRPVLPSRARELRRAGPTPSVWHARGYRHNEGATHGESCQQRRSPTEPLSPERHGPGPALDPRASPRSRERVARPCVRAVQDAYERRPLERLEAGALPPVQRKAR